MLHSKLNTMHSSPLTAGHSTCSNRCRRPSARAWRVRSARVQASSVECHLRVAASGRVTDKKASLLSKPFLVRSLVRASSRCCLELAVCLASIVGVSVALLRKPSDLTSVTRRGDIPAAGLFFKQMLDRFIDRLYRDWEGP